MLTVGYLSAILFVNNSTASSQKGIIENYNGNENDDEAVVMKFKKSRHEMLNILHTHILSMSIIFLILGLLIYGCPINIKLKLFLMLEPMISILITFGGIYCVWLGYEWMSSIVQVSGFLLSICFFASVCIIFNEILFKKERIRSSKLENW